MKSAPDKIGNYNIISQIGKGGMGVVYLAEHQKTSRKVALKTLHLLNANMLQSIRYEIMILARIRHPGIVEIVDQGIYNGIPWYAMELLEGSSLKQYHLTHSNKFFSKTIDYSEQELHEKETLDNNITKFTPSFFDNETAFTSDETKNSDEEDFVTSSNLSLSAVETSEDIITPISILKKYIASDYTASLTIIRRICEILSFLHGEGIVHCDLKLENIIILPEKRPILLDFGLMTQFTSIGISRETLSTEHIGTGTIPYMSPEAIDGGVIDPRTDLYSIGCILYELLTGYPPFYSRDPKTIINGHLYKLPVPISQIIEDFPPELDNLVLRLLEKNPYDRLGYADDVARILANFGAEESDFLNIVEPKPYLYKSHLAGRKKEIFILEKALDELLLNRGKIIFIKGESGIGKTRLVKEFTKEAIRQNVMVMMGECSDKRNNPLEVLSKPLQMIADLCRESGIEKTEKILGARGKVLALFEPSLTDLPGQDAYPAPSPLPTNNAHLRILNYLKQTFEILASEKPLLLIFDDIQWADDLTMEFLKFLQQSNELHLPFLILCTIRSEETTEDLQYIQKEFNIETLNLNRLNKNDIAFMVEDILAITSSPPSFNKFLADSSEGNPLFVVEYLRAAVEDKILHRNKIGKWYISQEDGTSRTLSNYQAIGLPKFLQEFFDRRFKKLPQKVMTIIEIASIVGREFEFSLLAETSDLDKGDFVETVQELYRKQFFERGENGVIRFTHDKIREFTYKQIAENKLPALHERVAKSIETLFSEHIKTYQAELGYHWELAGNKEKAKDYYFIAARNAAKQYATDKSERLYNAFLKLTQKPDLKSVDAHIELGNYVYFRLGKIEEAVSELHIAAKEAILIGKRDKEAEAYTALGSAYWSLGNIEISKSLFNKALSIAKEISDYALEGKLLSNLAGYKLFQESSEAALNEFENAHKIIEKYGSKSDNAKSFANMAICYRDMQNYDKSREYCEKAIKLNKEIDDKQGEAITLANLAAIPIDLNDTNEAYFILNKALNIVKEIGDIRTESVILTSIGDLFYSLNKSEEAVLNYEKALSLAKVSGEKRWIAYNLKKIGILIREMNLDLTKSEKYLEEAITIFEILNDYNQIIICFCHQGYNLIANKQSANNIILKIEQFMKNSELTNTMLLSDIKVLIENLKASQKAYEQKKFHLIHNGKLIEK